MASPLSDKGTQTVSEIPQPKNWRLRIEEARERDFFTQEDVRDARDWLSCACGRLDPRIPRYKRSIHFIAGTPKDRSLRWRGMDFADAVRFNEPDRAEVLLNKIEAREAELLAELTARDAEVHAQTPSQIKSQEAN